MSDNLYPRTRALRALIRRVRDGDFLRSGRQLVHKTGMGKGGVCCWCGYSVASKRGGWHDDCLDVYFFTQASTSRISMASFAPDGWRCAVCGEDRKFRDKSEVGGKQFLSIDYEIDHKVALALAHEHREIGDRQWWRAWMPINLRVLCHDCHAKKSGEERREINRLRKARKVLADV